MSHFTTSLMELLYQGESRLRQVVVGESYDLFVRIVDRVF